MPKVSPEPEAVYPDPDGQVEELVKLENWIVSWTGPKKDMFDMRSSRSEPVEPW
jgi:hypothetical protein